MMKINRKLIIEIIFFLIITQNLSASPLWQSNNIFLLHGNNYEVDSDEQTTITLEHASKWAFGDLFFFTDFTKYRKSTKSNGFYGEINPRLSLGSIFPLNFKSGLVKDILISSTVEFGQGDVDSFLVGPAIDLNVPGFNYFSLNIHQRFTSNGRDGETIQITPVWGVSHLFWGSKVTFEGYIDWNISSDGNYHRNIHFNPRLKFELDKLLQLKTGSASLGIEYSYWENKYGIKNSSNFDTNQNALSLFLNYAF